MNNCRTLGAAAAVALYSFASAHAGTTTISLGQSAENYVLYGQGPVAPGVGSFTNQQGDELYDATSNTTTESLTGLVTGSSDSSLASGTYDFITTFTGMPIGSGGTKIVSQSNPAYLNYFYYDFLDPSVDMTLLLTGTPTGTHSISLVTNGNFDGPGFSFADVTASCTGVTICGQNNVGLTPGASYSGPVTISVSYNTAVPEPATWAVMLIGFGVVGAVTRRRRGVRAAIA